MNALERPLCALADAPWRAHLDRFVTGSGGGVLALPTAKGLYRLAYSDAQQPQCLAANAAEGWYDRHFRPETVFSKFAQHECVRRIAPDLCLNGFAVESVQDLPRHTDDVLVVRPDRSAGSRGSAVMLGLGRETDKIARKVLKDIGGPFLMHRFEPGEAFFVNGVMSGGRLHLADIWRCFSFVVGCRPVLISVINMDACDLPAELPDQLERLAQNIGLRNGPVHFELLHTAKGVRLMKCAARLATDPLPALSRLRRAEGQVDLLARLLGNTSTPLARAAARGHLGGADCQR